MRRYYQIFSNINRQNYFFFFHIIILAIAFQVLLVHKLYAENNPFIKTDKNLKQIEFYPKEYENNEFFYFTKCNVYQLNEDMLNYVNINKSKIENEIKTFYNNKCRTLYYLNKDCPVFSDKIQYIRQRFDKIYGPAIIQYLSIIKDSDRYNNLSPDKVFKFWDTYFIKNVEKNNNQDTKKNYPFIFGITYDQDVAIDFLSSFNYEVNRGFSCFFFSYLPLLHPSILTNDSDYIVTNLLQRVERELTYEDVKIKWDISIPIYFKPNTTKLYKKQTDEICEVFETNIDGIIASFHVYPNHDSNISDFKANLEKISKDKEYLNSLVGDSKLISNNSIIELGKRPVLAIQYKKNLSAEASSSIAYIFAESRFIFEIKFTINNSDEKIAEECFKNNLPLFEKLATENSISIK